MFSIIPQNLDALHDHLGTLYPGMRAPSFRCTEKPGGDLVLHYYSDRPGLEHIVIGIVKVQIVRFGSGGINRGRSLCPACPFQRFFRAVRSLRFSVRYLYSSLDPFNALIYLNPDFPPPSSLQSGKAQRERSNQLFFLKLSLLKKSSEVYSKIISIYFCIQ